MRLFQYNSILFGIVFLFLSGCDSNTEVGSAGTNTPDQKQAALSEEKTTVSPAVEGALPAIADREKDMTLVARETQQQEAEREAIRKDMERGMGQPESERTAPQ